jgi:aryl-alcohol dehydrogenase-like predicted oxidoreductase
MVSTVNETSASVLGLAAHPDQHPDCIPRAFQSGINFFFFYGPGHKPFVDGLKPLVQRRRDDIILASGSGARGCRSLRAARRKILAAASAATIDIFFAEYINPSDDTGAVFGPGGVIDELQQWKSDGSIRYAGASTHDRKLAQRLAKDPRVDILMQRYNMAHRKAAIEVFPTAIEAKTPVIAFTATRWGTLLKPQPLWPDKPPTAAECYRYCLAHAAVRLVLTAPKTVAELDENIVVLNSPRMSTSRCALWERFGDVVYRDDGGGRHAYESRWP